MISCGNLKVSLLARFWFCRTFRTLIFASTCFHQEHFSCLSAVAMVTAQVNTEHRLLDPL